MPKKFISCVKKVTKEEMERYGKLKYNPYAVCRVATGYYGSTHEIGMIHPKHHSKCHKCKHLHCKHHPRHEEYLKKHILKF
jgi:hypothetical protein